MEKSINTFEGAVTNIEKNRAKFPHVDDRELLSRKDAVSELRARLLTARATINSRKALAKLDADRRAVRSLRLCVSVCPCVCVLVCACDSACSFRWQHLFGAWDVRVPAAPRVTCVCVCVQALTAKAERERVAQPSQIQQANDKFLDDQRQRQLQIQQTTVREGGGAVSSTCVCLYAWVSVRVWLCVCVCPSLRLCGRTRTWTRSAWP